MKTKNNTRFAWHDRTLGQGNKVVSVTDREWLEVARRVEAKLSDKEIDEYALVLSREIGADMWYSNYAGSKCIFKIANATDQQRATALMKVLRKDER